CVHVRTAFGHVRTAFGARIRGACSGVPTPHARACVASRRSTPYETTLHGVALHDAAVGVVGLEGEERYDEQEEVAPELLLLLGILDGQGNGLLGRVGDVRGWRRDGGVQLDRIAPRQVRLTRIDVDGEGERLAPTGRQVMAGLLGLAEEAVALLVQLHAVDAVAGSTHLPRLTR